MVRNNFFEPVVSHEKMHSNFIGTLGPAYGNARSLFNEWADGFIDRDNKIIKEFQTTFNSTFGKFIFMRFLKIIISKLIFLILDLIF